MRAGLLEKEASPLSIRAQCRLVGVSRSYLYYQPKRVSQETLELMHRIDALHTAYPFFGTRQMTRQLRREGTWVNRKRVQRLMTLMGLVSMAPGPHTSKPHSEHTIYPYLLRGLCIERPNQVWATDITYLRMERGFGYLCAVTDWFSRYVLSFRLSNTMDTRFCIEALREALRTTQPEIFNTDQGTQFTSHAFTAELLSRKIKISMDGKGRALDNIVVERLWRSVKYEDVYLKSYGDLKEAHKGLENYFKFFNEERGHSSLLDRVPAEVYFDKERMH